MISNGAIGMVSFTMSNVPTKTSIIMAPKAKFVGETSLLHTIFKMWVQSPYSTLSKPYSSWAWDYAKGVDLSFTKMSFILWSLLFHSWPIYLIDSPYTQFSITCYFGKWVGLWVRIIPWWI
jgi:hypothetical protein